MKIPGFLWTTGIAVAIFACQTLLAPEYAVYGSMAVVILMGAAKFLNIGEDEVEKLVSDLYAAQSAAGVPRGIAIPTPRARGKLERWLVG